MDRRVRNVKNAVMKVSAKKKGAARRLRRINGPMSVSAMIAAPM